MIEGVSVLSVEPWLVEHWLSVLTHPFQARFSALSRAVVGGTKLEVVPDEYLTKFQCSQSSRGWWNRSFSCTMSKIAKVSVLSVEPWLVELYFSHANLVRDLVSVLSVEPWLVELFA